MIRYFREMGLPEYRQHYYAGEEGNPDEGIDAHLSMVTRHYPRLDNIFYPDEFGDYSNNARLSWESPWRENKQIPLFRHVYAPATNMVGYVSGTERGRTHFPLLLSIANNDSMRRYGIPLTPDNDLSPHSWKFVNNLQRKGIVNDPEGTLPSAPTNHMTFQKHPSSKAPYDLDQIPDTEVKKGKEALKEMLRKSRNLSSQFATTTEEQHHQLELDL